MLSLPLSKTTRSSCHDIDDHLNIAFLSIYIYIYNREKFSYPFHLRDYPLSLSLSLFSPNCVVDSTRVQGKRVLLFPRSSVIIDDSASFLINVRRKREREDRRHLVCLESNLDSTRINIISSSQSPIYAEKKKKKRRRKRKKRKRYTEIR